MATKAEIEAELLAIRAANGGILTARMIVEAASDPAHLLHSHFEWRDDVAGPKYRVQQARQLVRVIREVYVGARGHPEQIRVFHSMPVPSAPGGRAYVPLDEIKANEVMTAQLKRQMEMEWRALRRKYDHFEDFIRMVRRDTPPSDDGDDGDNGGDEPLVLEA